MVSLIRKGYVNQKQRDWNKKELPQITGNLRHVMKEIKAELTPWQPKPRPVIDGIPDNLQELIERKLEENKHKPKRRKKTT